MDADDLVKVAVVVGVGPGLGSAVARRFAAGGYRVAVLRRSAGKCAKLVKELEKSGNEAMAVACDMADVDSVKAAFAEVRGRWESPSVVVLNASGFLRGGICAIDPAAFEVAVRVSTLGPLLCMQQVLPAMEERGVGCILVTGATASTRGSANFAGFAVGKTGLRTLAQSAAREYGPKGVHIAHIIVDGMLDEPRARAAFPDVAEDSLISPAALADTYFHVAMQPQSTWTFELDVRASGERW